MFQYRSGRRSIRRRTSRHLNVESLEVRTLLAAEPFQQPLLYATTVMPESDPQFTMQVADWDDDTISDILLIQRSGTSTGQVEVSVYSSGFASFDARNNGSTTPYTSLMTVALPATNADWDFRIEHWNGGTRPDLFAIHKANTASGFVEVTVFTGESNFADRTLFQTSLSAAYRDWVFDVGHYNNDGLADLFAIRRNGEVSTELFIASGAPSSVSGPFSTLLLQTATALPRTNDTYAFVVADLGNDGIADLLAIRKYATDFGRVEVSVLPGGTSPLGEAPFRWFSARTATRLTDSATDWEFDTTWFSSPFAPTDDGLADLVGLRKLVGGAPDVYFLSGSAAQSTAVFGAAAVPSSVLSTTADRSMSGLVGSFVNSSLRSESGQNDWRISQTIAGSRVDPTISFTTNSLGSRAGVNVTGGTDSNWDFFSVQWDGYITIPSDGVRLRTSNSDGSRMWIDLNDNGQFDAAGAEFINNGWGQGKDVTVGPQSIQLAAGTYRIRLQFENGYGPNQIQLLWDYVPTVVPANVFFTDPGKTTPGITGSYVNSSLRDPAAPMDWRQNPAVQISGTRIDPAINFPLPSLGTRSTVGVTSGSDRQWDSFSVQWDGFIVIPANGVRLFTRSDDGSRLWIDVNRDGIFANTATEALVNGWGTGQAATLSGGSVPLAAGTYPIRVQYEEGFGGNVMQLLWDYQPIQRPTAVITGISSSAEQRPTITWTPVVGAAGYDLWIDNLATKTSAYVRATTTDAWLTPTTDLGIGQYAVWVRSSDIAGRKSAWSPRATFRIDPPVTLKQVLSTPWLARPVISWNPLPGAVKYDLWIDNLSIRQSQFIRVTNHVGTQWSSSTDLPMARYRMWVRGVDASGGTATWSVAADFTVATAPVPISPLVPTFERRPTFSWQPLAGAVQYNVTLEYASSGGPVYHGSRLTDTSWTVGQDVPTGRYRWYVSAISADGFRSYSPIVTDFYIGGRPTVLGPAGTTSSTKPEFTWTAVTGAASYQLWVNRLNAPVTTVINVSGLTDTRYTPSTALAKGNYRVWVRAVSTANETSVWSIYLEFSIVDQSPKPDLRDLNRLRDAVLVVLPDRSSDSLTHGRDVADVDQQPKQTQPVPGRTFSEPSGPAGEDFMDFFAAWAEQVNANQPPEVAVQIE